MLGNVKCCVLFVIQYNFGGDRTSWLAVVKWNATISDGGCEMLCGLQSSGRHANWAKDDWASADPKAELGRGMSRSLGGRKSPTGIQGRSPAESLGNEVSRFWNIFVHIHPEIKTRYEIKCVIWYLSILAFVQVYINFNVKLHGKNDAWHIVGMAPFHAAPKPPLQLSNKI